MYTECKKRKNTQEAKTAKNQRQTNNQSNKKIPEEVGKKRRYIRKKYAEEKLKISHICVHLDTNQRPEWQPGVLELHNKIKHKNTKKKVEISNSAVMSGRKTSWLKDWLWNPCHHCRCDDFMSCTPILSYTSISLDG